MHLHTSLSRPRLVQLLAGWTDGASDPPRQDVAEQLAPWLGVPDAIALHAAHQGIGAPARGQAPVAGVQLVQALDDELKRVRATLEQSVAAGGRPARRSASARLPAEPAPPEAPGFGPWQQRHSEQQRRMDMSIEALRAHVRESLARASPRLAQLAALDGALHAILGAREQRLLAQVPAFLERRFEQLRPAEQADDDGRWRSLFEQEFQAVLRAELDLRLQPVIGLLDALSNEVKTWQ
ncbi:MAG: DUF3348 family protein [Hydrogenophaga sp.]|nr:DUF3348 family protein [Hydrogenophaga sp.]